MAVLRETISRAALIALSSQYGSVADALMEIVDNPFDYRHGRRLTVRIKVEKSKDRVTVVDVGGEGMNDRTLSDWIEWGTGHEHRSTDIGQWHVGGKLAAMYLAESLEIVCRKAGELTICRFADPHWGSRTELLTTEPERVSGGALLNSLLSEHGTDKGFTEIVLRRLKPHRYELETIRSRLANTYRTLLQRNACAISVDAVPVSPLDLPEDPAHQDKAVSFKERLPSGVTVKGRIWVIDRDKFKPGRGGNVEAGIRTVFNGRLITSGEQFGHWLAGRGSLQRLMGEIELEHIKPNATKNGWDTDSPKWADVEAFMSKQMQPLVTFLNSYIEGKPVSRDLRKRAEQVRRDVAETLKRLRAAAQRRTGTVPDDGVAPLGRTPPTPRPDEPPPAGTRQRGKVENRTPPPEDAIGRLLRRVQSGVPRINFDDLGRTSRSQPRMTDAGPEIVINRDYPLYVAIGETEEYIVETVLMHLLTQDDESSLAPKELGARLDEMMFVWRDVAGT